MSKCILFIVTKSETGGAQKFVAEQIRISQKDYRVLLATNQQDWLTEEVKDLVEDMLLDKRIESRTSAPYLLKLIKFIKQHKVDLVICNSANAGLYGRIAAYWCGIRSIYVSHGWGAVYNGGKLAAVLFAIERMLARIGTSVLCISDADYQKATEKVGIPGKKLYTIKNCIPPVKPLSPPLTLPDSHGKLKLLSVARFSHPKRMDLLSMAVKNMENVELYLVGTGPLAGEVKSLVAVNGLKNVHFLGEIRGFDRFADFDAFSLISDSEGLSVSALEAISAGLPVMLSKVGGCPELVENNGVLVNNEQEDISNGIKLLCEKLDFYRNNARPFFDKNFNLEINKNKYLDYYQSILKE